MPGVGHLVIVAGGKGSRMAGAHADIPKALIPIGGKPVLQHQLELAAAAGIGQATVLAGHLADQIAAFVGDGGRFGLNARTLTETEPLGNAGALIQALDSLPEHFFVLYGDVMLDVDLGRMAQAHLGAEADFTTLAHPNDHPFDSDLLETDAEDRVTAVHAYPHPEGRTYANLVNAALYVARREALRPWAGMTAGGDAKLDFTKDILAGLVARGAKVLAYRSREYIKDMGTPHRLAKVEADWRAGRVCRPAGAGPAAAVFLDRDGTLNVERGFLSRAQDLELIPGAGSALRTLRQAGFLLVVVTNQPVIARGEASEADVDAIHQRLEWELGKQGAFLDAIYLCPHHPDRGFEGERPELKGPCDCRKPATGLVDRACAEIGIDPARSWIVGDQTRDIELGRRAGLRSVLVRTGQAGKDGAFGARPDHVADDLAAAAAAILAQRTLAA